MALKRLANGQYVIGSKKEALSALTLFHTMQDEIDEIREKYGLREIEEDQIELKKAVTAWFISSGTEELEVPERDGMYGKLIEQGYDKRIIATDEELAEYTDSDRPLVQEKVIPLRKVLVKKYGKGTKEFKEIWNRCTKRVADPTEIEKLIADGELTVKEVAKSYAEKKKTPYLRFFGGS